MLKDQAMNAVAQVIEITSLLQDTMKCTKMTKKEKLKSYKVWPIKIRLSMKICNTKTMQFLITKIKVYHKNSNLTLKINNYQANSLMKLRKMDRIKMYIINKMILIAKLIILKKIFKQILLKLKEFKKTL